MADVHDPGGAAELEKLAAQLDSTAYAVTLVSAEGRRPCLSLTNRRVPQATEFIYAAPGDDSEWWFWWGWATRICPGADLASAAAAIDRVLPVLGGNRGTAP